MEKEKLYHIALDYYEHGVVIRSLNDDKTKLMEMCIRDRSKGETSRSSNFGISSVVEKTYTPKSLP